MNVPRARWSPRPVRQSRHPVRRAPGMAPGSRRWRPARAGCWPVTSPRNNASMTHQKACDTAGAAAAAAIESLNQRSGEQGREPLRALIIGAGMGGLCAALALRESKVFAAVDVFEQTATPSTAGAGLNIPPNGARLCTGWLGVDLDGGDPLGEHGAVDGGRAAILDATRMIADDNTVSRKPLDHVTAAGDG